MKPRLRRGSKPRVEAPERAAEVARLRVDEARRADAAGIEVHGVVPEAHDRGDAGGVMLAPLARELEPKLTGELRIVGVLARTEPDHDVRRERERHGGIPFRGGWGRLRGRATNRVSTVAPPARRRMEDSGAECVVPSAASMARQLSRRKDEHDAILRAVLLTFSARTRAMVVYPHDSDATWRAVLPDLIITNSASGRIVRLLTIETRASMARPCSERWHGLARRAPLTVVVPKGAAERAERLLLPTDARIIEYERDEDGEVVFNPAI